MGKKFPCPFKKCNVTANANYGVHSFADHEGRIGHRWGVDDSGVKRWWCKRHAEWIANRLNLEERALNVKGMPVTVFQRIIASKDETMPKRLLNL